MKIKLMKRPGKRKKVVSEVVDIITSLTGTWFTPSVQEYIPKDLYFQDILCLYNSGRIQSFIIFTSLDGIIYIMLMATRPEKRNKGFGKYLYEYFETYVKRWGYDCIRVQTVPEQVNPNYKETIQFYERRGFKIIKHYQELWEHGALELEKRL